MNNNFFKVDIDFSQFEVVDWISPDEFMAMSQEVISDSFIDGEFVPFMKDFAIYKSILKHCFGFNVDDYSDEEMFAICIYSDFKQYLEQLNQSNDNKIGFIITQLNDTIMYHKDSLLHTNKIDGIIDSLIELISQLDLSEINEKISSSIENENNNIEMSDINE